VSPLQRIAMGLVLVVLDVAAFADLGLDLDAIPDVAGWVLVLMGVRNLRDRLHDAGTLLGLGTVAAAVSVVLLWPGVASDLDESVAWLLSLPQLVFTLLLCGALARLLEDDAPEVARRLSLLRWVFGLVAVGPVLLYGGGVDALLVPLSVLAVAANVFLVYLLFRHHAQPSVARTAPAG
jgi:hypothetical protein